VHCQFCRSSIPAWQRVAASNPQLKTLLVAKDPLPDVVAFLAAGVTVPGVTVTDPTFETYSFLRMATVPSTILLGKDGVVLKVWVGEIDPAVESDIRSFVSQAIAVAPIEGTQEGS
jgi:hypothetical protein